MDSPPSISNDNLSQNKTGVKIKKHTRSLCFKKAEKNVKKYKFVIMKQRKKKREHFKKRAGSNRKEHLEKTIVYVKETEIYKYIYLNF